MIKSEVLSIGFGGCGNNLLDTFLGLDFRYSGIFMNTNLSEMENKVHFDRERRCFYIANADGTGKDRSVGEKYFKQDSPKFVEMIVKYVNQKHVILKCSANGGTGSISSLLGARLIKKSCPEKSISLIATMPNIGEGDIDFKNAIAFWNELNIALDKGIINNVSLIDNNSKMSQDEINRIAMDTLDLSFSDVINNSLDSSDVARYHRSRGYNVTLKLDNTYRDTNDAINDAIDNSVFFIPTSNKENGNIECDTLVATVNINDFKVEEIEKRFSAYEFKKINQTTEGDTIILLGGCDMPEDAIELTQEALKEVQKRKTMRKGRQKQNLIVEIDENDVQPKTESKNTKVPSRISSKDLNDLFADDSFWED